MKKREFYQEEKMKKTIYVFSITLLLSIVVFLTVFVMYNKKLKEESSMNLDNLGMMEDIVSNDDLEETSFSTDLSIKDSLANKVTNTSKKSSNTTKVSRTPVESAVINTVNKTSNVVENTNIVSNTLSNENTVKELEFSAPVSGEIIKDYAVDTLIYSNTLEEWTTHSGIDIKADKTTIVTAAEGGTIESIKNDPRYGLTITISHNNGFKTIYSNLLTTEFVSENEVVEKGQTIATVGETASFEVADESHLHFEMYKDGVAVNPTIYLK